MGRRTAAADTQDPELTEEELGQATAPTAPGPEGGSPEAIALARAQAEIRQLKEDLAAARQAPAEEEPDDGRYVNARRMTHPHDIERFFRLGKLSPKDVARFREDGQLPPERVSE